MYYCQIESPVISILKGYSSLDISGIYNSTTMNRLQAPSPPLIARLRLNLGQSLGVDAISAPADFAQYKGGGGLQIPSSIWGVPLDFAPQVSH